MTLFDLAQRFIGIKEIPGNADHPLIQWWLSLCEMGNDEHDEVAWCSAFLNGMAWMMRLPRSKSAAARSWLGVGSSKTLAEAKVGFDIVILKRGGGNQPGPEVIKAQGHVGIFAGLEITEHGEGIVLLLAGNQGNAVSIARFSESDVLGVRSLL